MGFICRESDWIFPHCTWRSAIVLLCFLEQNREEFDEIAWPQESSFVQQIQPWPLSNVFLSSASLLFFQQSTFTKNTPINIQGQLQQFGRVYESNWDYRRCVYVCISELLIHITLSSIWQFSIGLKSAFCHGSLERGLAAEILHKLEKNTCSNNQILFLTQTM